MALAPRVSGASRCGGRASNSRRSTPHGICSRSKQRPKLCFAVLNRAPLAHNALWVVGTLLRGKTFVIDQTRAPPHLAIYLYYVCVSEHSERTFVVGQSRQPLIKADESGTSTPGYLHVDYFMNDFNSLIFLSNTLKASSMRSSMGICPYDSTKNSNDPSSFIS